MRRERVQALLRLEEDMGYLAKDVSEVDASDPEAKLCATDSLEAFGSCRLCLVEIEGRRGTPASCTTPAEDGMVVHTKTPRLQRLRRGVMELTSPTIRSTA